LYAQDAHDTQFNGQESHALGLCQREILTLVPRGVQHSCSGGDRGIRILQLYNNPIRFGHIHP
jgi:hypothetical protein